MYNMNTLKSFIIKNNKYVDFCIITDKQNSNKFFILALNNNKQVGFCHFFIENNECKISRIAVTNHNFISLGIGSIMFNIMENFLYHNKIKNISGLFIPRGYDNAWKITSDFYKRHNMKSLEYDFNYIERDELYKKVELNDEKYDLPLLVNKIIYEKINKYNYEINDMFSSSYSINKYIEAPLMNL